ncbi:CLUMA_CG011730, isoform A [Clunio marinus]|uniref:CLUMA_CG011730, isoform A n=1 Tax=Clunio marinus TaxID=568069 RepID=A0A1J1IDS9_9DIPT|nr:CLUMA_CG011730, isoform A [Clunio marinus]
MNMSRRKKFVGFPQHKLLQQQPTDEHKEIVFTNGERLGLVDNLLVSKPCNKALFTYSNLRRDFLVIIVVLSASAFPCERMPIL